MRTWLKERGFDESQSNTRFGQSLDILLGRKRIHVQEPCHFYFPQLPQKQFYDRADFPWLDAIEAATDDIRAELQGVLQDAAAFTPYVTGDPNRPYSEQMGMTNNPAWTAFYLWQNGELNEANAARCPQTMAALADAPLARIPGHSPSVLFSQMPPGTHIAPRNGPTNTRLQVHLPLVVPGKCRLACRQRRARVAGRPCLGVRRLDGPRGLERQRPGPGHPAVRHCAARADRRGESLGCDAASKASTRSPARSPSGTSRPRRSMLYLVDASVFIFRAWFSVPVDVADRDGNPVNAVLGFARFLAELLEKESPRHIAVAFDESLEQGYRNEIYPAYKANREPAPIELKRQFALCQEICAALGVARYSSSRYEADDIIGTLATRARAAGLPVTIVSRDKDLTQLLSSVDVYWDAVADVRYGYDDIAERFGVVPERMADFLALMGDAVDNIPGVPGVGRKTAQTLLKHFHTLEGVLDSIDQIGKLKFRNATFVAESLREHRETALLSRRLTAIACDMPLPISRMSELRLLPPDLATLDTFCETQNFGRLLRDQARRLHSRHAA